jgi:mannose-6-phosphate isomerase-like protein (cupin superfamily)
LNRNNVEKDINKSRYFKAIDETVLCELMHPKNDAIDTNLSIAHAILEPGKSSLPHIINKSIEIYYILEGKGEMNIDQETQVVTEGQAIYIPSNARQWIKNIGNSNLKFLCIVSPPWTEDNEYLCQ